LPHLVLPNFFIAGAPKAGTTSLYHQLDQHPEVYMSPVKEPCYFASEIRLENFAEEYQPRVNRDQQALQQYLAGSLAEKRFGGMISEWTDYLKLFQNGTGAKAIGEASVCYLWSPTAAKNIAAQIPHAKIILILRDPAERAFSQYLHTVADGLVRRSFREQIELSIQNNGKFSVLHPFLEFGLYHDQVKRYLELFPRDSLRIYLYETDHERILLDVLRFLNLDSNVVLDTSERHLKKRVPRSIAPAYFLKKYGVWQQAKEWIPGALQPLVRSAVLSEHKTLRIEPQDRKYLIDYYREDIRKLAYLLDRDLEAWLH
jgi:hypothetical protein